MLIGPNLSDAHGQHFVQREGQVIRVKLSGSFNEAGVCAYAAEVKEIVASLSGQPFAMLIDDLDVEGGTPKAYAALNDYNEWLNQQSVIAKAFVINSLALKDIILQRTPELQRQNIAFFFSYNDAEKWLIEQFSPV